MNFGLVPRLAATKTFERIKLMSRNLLITSSISSEDLTVTLIPLAVSLVIGGMVACGAIVLVIVGATMTGARGSSLAMLVLVGSLLRLRTSWTSRL